MNEATTWYLVTWRSHSGRRGSFSPTHVESYAKDLAAALNDPKSTQIRKFTTQPEAERAHFRIQCSR